MFRFNRIVCAALVCAVAGVAFGAVVKIKAINAVGAGVDLHPDCDGMAIFHYKEPQGNADAGTEVNIVLTDFEPNTTYSVRYEGDIPGNPGFPLGGTPTVTTNAAGNAHVHDFFSGFDITSSPRVIVFIDDGDGDYNPDLDEDRACGGSNCPT